MSEIQMTLVIARKHGNLTFLLGDTQSFDEISGIRDNPFADPIVKVIRVGPCVVGFAGNIAWAEKLFSDIENEVRVSNILSSSRTVIEESQHRLQLIVVDVESSDIFEMKNGQVRKVDRSWIGSLAAFEEYQRLFHDGDASAEAETRFSMLKMPESDGDEHYSRAFAAFSRMLTLSRSDVGGFCTPYFIAGSKAQYGNYVEMNRPPIGADELHPGLPTPISFGDATMGSFGISFSGIESSFAAHLLQGQAGTEYGGLKSNGLRPEFHANIDEIDFFDTMVRRRGIDGVRANGTGRHLATKAYALYIKSDPESLVRASELLDRAIVTFSRTWRKNGGPLGKEAKSLAAAMSEIGDAIDISADDAPYIVAALRLRVEIERARNRELELIAAIDELIKFGICEQQTG